MQTVSEEFDFPFKLKYRAGMALISQRSIIVKYGETSGRPASRFQEDSMHALGHSSFFKRSTSIGIIKPF